MIKILFLGANPSDTTRLALDREVREIVQRLRAAPHGERFLLVQEWAVRIGDLQAALLRHRPQIVHFSGHGGQGTSGGELLVEDEAGHAVPISGTALADLLRIVGGVRCVVLNACYSAIQAEVIRQHVECVLGMGCAIGDRATIAFAGAFYQALAFGEDVTAAFELGKNQIALAGLGESDAPQMFLREDLARNRHLFGMQEHSGALTPVPPNGLPPRRLFMGRAEELVIIEAAMARDGRVSLCGLSGVGKTALALEYAYRNATRYPGGIWWLASSGRPEEALLRLAPPLRAVGPMPLRMVLGQVQLDAPAQVLAQTVRLALQNHPERSLLVLDGVTSEAWPRAIPGGLVDVLLTTHDRRLGLGAHVLVDMLPTGQALALTREIAGEPADEREASARMRVLAELGGLPMAVETAARAVEQWAGSWAEYERLLSQEMESALDVPLADYAHSVFAALDMSLLRCGAETAERRLLEGAAAFAPEVVPIGWAEKAAGLPPRGIEAKRALAALTGMGLVRVDAAAQSLTLHQLVHRRVRAQADADRWAKTRERSVRCLAAWLVKTVSLTRLEEVDVRRAHIDEALLAAGQLEIHDAAVTIASRLGTHLQHRALFTEARASFELALSKAQALGPGEIATALSNLALLLRDMGHPTLGHPLLERSLSLVEAMHGADHPKVATRLANIAIVLKAFGRTREARALLERALAIDERALGAEHFKVATILTSLATVLQDLGDAAAALPLLERARRIAVRAHGDNHPRVATVLSNLAMVMRDLDRVGDASVLLERALEIDVRTYGADHPRTRGTRENLALVRRESSVPRTARDGERRRPPAPAMAASPPMADETRADTSTFTNMDPVRQAPSPAMSPARADDLGPGARAGDHVVERFLARGGCASVYLARRENQEQLAAVKVMHGSLAVLPKMVERFHREVDMVGMLRHPNIVEIYQVGRLRDGRPFYAMEYLRGRTLSAILEEKGHLSPPAALEVLAPVCDALGAAHAAGIVHRDVKASNIMVVNGSVKLLDFGVAKLVGPQSHPIGLTTTVGRQVGTITIMAPEQLLGAQVDARIDVYALGVLLYQLLTGELPFKATTPLALAQQHLEAPAPRPSLRVPIASTLDGVVLRAMEKRPERRYGSAQDFCTALRRAVAPHSEAPPLDEVPKASQ